MPAWLSLPVYPLVAPERPVAPMKNTMTKERTVHSNSEGMELELTVEGMSCQHCLAAMTGAVGSVPGVVDVAMDLGTGGDRS
jgi:hypothetical protein